MIEHQILAECFEAIKSYRLTLSGWRDLRAISMKSITKSRPSCLTLSNASMKVF